MAERSIKLVAPAAPVLRVTPYEKVSSWLMALIVALGASVAMLGMMWFAARVPPTPVAVPVELIDVGGGAEEGFPDESLRIDNQSEASPDATVAEIPADEREAKESLDNVLELADQVAQQTDQQLDQGTQNSGRSASAMGTGRRALGSGPGTGGFPREQRWYIRFGDQQSLDEYAQQLDFFGIEFGAIVDGKLAYVSKLSAPRPQVRTASGGGGETRLYMTWQGGGRKQADLQLFKKAGIEVGQGALFQFYPKPVEETLARLEIAWRNRRVEEIRRTYFEVVRKDGGYAFSVTRQTYLK